MVTHLTRLLSLVTAVWTAFASRSAYDSCRTRASAAGCQGITGRNHQAFRPVRWKHSFKLCTLSAEEFIRRFLQHVLPDRFVKVRYYGFLAPTNRHLLDSIRGLLGAPAVGRKPVGKDSDAKELGEGLRCPKCGTILIFVQTLEPRSRLPP